MDNHGIQKEQPTENNQPESHQRNEATPKSVKEILQSKCEALQTSFSKRSIFSIPKSKKETEKNHILKTETGEPTTPDSAQKFKLGNIKFSSNGLPLQKSKFTPIIYRRAVSIRGHSTKSKEKKDRKSTDEEEIDENVSRKSDICDGMSSTSDYCNKVNKIPELSLDEIQEQETSKVEFRTPYQFSTYIGKCDNEVKGKNNSNHNETSTNCIMFFNANLEDYLLSLNELVNIHLKMKIKTPERIRQYFDLPSRLVEAIFNVQRDINKEIKLAQEDFTKISKILLSDRLRVYQHYMIACPEIYENVSIFRHYFDIYLPTYKNLILLPSSRLNYFSQTLSNFLKFASYLETSVLKKTIGYLENLKREANKEMTINIVKKSPIDLHLVGDLLFSGQLTYSSGPLSKRQYYMIAFEEILLFTIPKASICEYVIHFRYEQVLEIVKKESNNELILETSTYNQETTHIHRLLSTTRKLFKEWIKTLNNCLQDRDMDNKNRYSICHYIFAKGNCFPLSLSKVFPQLQEEVLRNDQHLCKSSTLGSLVQQLIQEEKDYIKKLKLFFNPENLPPPAEIEKLLLKIFDLHQAHLLPELLEAAEVSHEAAVDVFMNYIEKLHIYQGYLLLRTMFVAYLPDGYNIQYYILPIEHFAFYFRWIKSLSVDNRYNDACSFALDSLLAIINETKTSLLRRAVPNCLIDFDRIYDIKMEDKVRIRVAPKQKCIQDNIYYTLLLFKNVILVLMDEPPHHKLMYVMWMYQIHIGAPTDNTLSFKLEVRQGGDKLPISFEIISNDLESKEMWMEAIKKELHLEAQKIKVSSFNPYNCLKNN